MMNSESAHAAIAAEEGQLDRVIGVTGVAFTAFNAIVGAGIFGLPALVAAILGPAAILAYLVCIALVGLIGLCFAEAGSRVPSSGGPYAYARAAFGPTLAGVTGMLLLIANSVASGAALARFLADTVGTIWPDIASPGGRTAFLAAIYLTFATINIRSARYGAGLTTVMAFVKLAPLILLVVAGLALIKPANLLWPAMPPITAIGSGAMLLFFAFMGVETGLGTGGETINPARTIPRAILLALTLVAALYIGLQTVAQGVLGAALPTATAPLVETGTAIFGAWGTRLLLITTILSATGFLVADLLGSPRTAFALAERGQLPRWIAWVHPRYHTPAIAIGGYAVLSFAMAASGSFRQLAIMSSSGTLIVYLISCLAVLRLRKRGIALAGKPFRAPGGVLVPIAAAAIIVWLLSTLTWPELATTAGLAIVSGLTYGLLQRRVAGKRDRQAGQ